jgi:phage-related protein
MDMILPQRPVHWVGSSLDDLKEMPEEVQDTMGKSLLQVQRGDRPRNAKVLQGFHGASVLEIKDDFDSDTYRCVYTVRFAEAVYVLHAFMKKSRAGISTSQKDIAKINTRLRDAEEHYQETYAVEKQEEDDGNKGKGTRGKR